MSLEKQSKNKSTCVHAQKGKKITSPSCRRDYKAQPGQGPWQVCPALALPSAGSSVTGTAAPLAAFDSFC